MFGVMEFVFPSNHDAIWGPVFLEIAKYLPVHRKQ